MGVVGLFRVAGLIFTEFFKSCWFLSCHRLSKNCQLRFQFIWEENHPNMSEEFFHRSQRKLFFLSRNFFFIFSVPAEAFCACCGKKYEIFFPWTRFFLGYASLKVVGCGQKMMASPFILNDVGPSIFTAFKNSHIETASKRIIMKVNFVLYFLTSY